jgi:hypothetical protein
MQVDAEQVLSQDLLEPLNEPLNLSLHYRNVLASSVYSGSQPSRYRVGSRLGTRA